VTLLLGRLLNAQILQQDAALGAKHRHIVLGDQPDHVVFDVGVFVRKPVAEVDDATSMSNLGDEVGERAREGGDSLSNSSSRCIHELQ
jgi:hypothetical protein